MRPVQKPAIWDNVVVKDSMWCYPEENSYRKRLDEVYKDTGRFKKQATELKKWIVQTFTKEKMYQKVNDAVDACYGVDMVTTVETPQISQQQDAKIMML